MKMCLMKNAVVGTQVPNVLGAYVTYFGSALRRWTVIAKDLGNEQQDYTPTAGRSRPR